jgi:hypothetical protein
MHLTAHSSKVTHFMLEHVVQICLGLAALYVLGGVLFAALFHARGIARVDHAAQGASKGFRVLVTPGIVALWPLVWKRWREPEGSSWLGSQTRPVPAERLRRRHGMFIILVLVLVLVIAIPALVLRPGNPVQPGAVKQLFHSVR